MSGLGSPLASQPPAGAGGPPMPGMPPKPAGVGPVTLPSVNAGNQVKAHAAIKNAAEGLQQALLQMPMGSEEHTKLLKIVKELSGMTADSAPDPQAQVQHLAQMAKQQSQRGAPPGLNSMMPAMAPPGGGPSPAAEAA